MNRKMNVKGFRLMGKKRIHLKYRIIFGEGSPLYMFREENVKVFDLRKKVLQ